MELESATLSLTLAYGRNEGCKSLWEGILTETLIPVPSPKPYKPFNPKPSTLKTLNLPKLHLLCRLHLGGGGGRLPKADEGHTTVLCYLYYTTKYYTLLYSALQDDHISFFPYCILCTVDYAIYRHCLLYTVMWILYPVYCVLYTVYCILLITIYYILCTFYYMLCIITACTLCMRLYQN